MEKPDRDVDIDLEAIQIGLDQLSQTLEVMARVVTRLKCQIADSQSAGDRRRSDKPQQAQKGQNPLMH